MSIDLGYDPIQKLEELQPLLQESRSCPHPVKVFGMEDGRGCPVWSLLDEDGRVSVAYFNMPEGGVFVNHKHDEFEILIPYKGAIMDLNSGKRAGPKEFLYMNPGEPHRIKAEEDTWAISVAVPSSEGYPHACR